MDSKKRTILVAAIAITIIAGVLSSFGLPLFFQTSSIILPDINEDAQSNPQNGVFDPNKNSDYIVIDITKENVQDVIAATLQRKNQYYRELSVKRFFGPDEETQGATWTVFIWNDGEYSKTAIMSAEGSMKYSLMAEGKKYTWYGSEKKWSTSFDNDTDFEQNIPTYEDVLTLDPKDIVQAAYETKLGSNCIFVERLVAELDYLERYWISTDSGLLVASETVKKETGELTYRMEENMMQDLKPDTAFTLPDGTVLHRVVGSQTEE